MAAPKQEPLDSTRLDSTRLDSTYSEASIHNQWQAVYRRSRAQIAFDGAVYRWLFRKIKPASGWLDAGCGTGQHAFRLAAHGCDVTCVDISAEALAEARRRVPPAVSGRIRFFQCALEDLSTSSIPHEIGNVHCRGVLMHTPDWRTAVRNLSPYVQNGGYFVIFESNAASLEWAIVRFIRWFGGRKSRMSRTEAGLEFWAEKEGHPFLVRMFDLNAIARELATLGYTLYARRSLFLLDINRIPPAIRTPFRLLNHLWFMLNGPLSSGVVLIFRRDASRRD
jgi:SAM-dependent methyltransferase